MKWRTTTRPNGQADHRETIYGLDAICGFVAVILTIIGAAWTVSSDLSAQNARMTMLESNLPDKIAAALSVQASTNDYVTRHEWDQHIEETRASYATISDRIAQLREDFQDDARHNRTMLERLPGARETTR